MLSPLPMAPTLGSSSPDLPPKISSPIDCTKSITLPPSLPPSSPPAPSTITMTIASSSPPHSPSSDKRFWTSLPSRVKDLLENNRKLLQTSSFSTQPGEDGSNRAKRLKESSMLLKRGFDSVAFSLSRLSSNIDNALQGAGELAKPPTLTEMLEITCSEEEAQIKSTVMKLDENAKGIEEGKKGVKRKLGGVHGPSSDDHDICLTGMEGDGSNQLNEKDVKRKLGEIHGSSSDEDVGCLSGKNGDHRGQVNGKLQKAKSMAISMAAKATELARELKSMKRDFFFMKQRCDLLEEENQRLRDGFEKGIEPEEDDLVRLQLEALLGEKSRLAYENANLTRENQCLRQLVEYHQFASQDLSASCEDLLEGICLDFSSPLATPEHESAVDGDSQDISSQVL